MKLERIVSGGQTGVDRAALDAAIALGIPHGGWCPKGRRAEDGVIPVRYALRETVSADYQVRTRQNVMDSDATLIIAPHELSGGTLLTANVARELQKLLLVLDLGHVTEQPEQAAGQLRAWLERENVRVLNVAGPRESDSQGVHDTVYAFLLRAVESQP